MVNQQCKFCRGRSVWLLLSFLAIFTSFNNNVAIVHAVEMCTPCEGEIDPTLSFDGVSCENWLAMASSAPADSPQCSFDRMLGIWFCGCSVPDQVEETCTLCSDGSLAFNGAKHFPESNVTCQDIASIPAIDGNKTCDELRLMGDYCECPVSTAKCSMCPNGETPAQLERMFLDSGETCQYTMDILAVSPKSNCELYIPSPMVDMASFCGCPGSEAPKTCSFCPQGTQVLDKDKPTLAGFGITCAEFETYTDYITDDMMCDYVHEVISMECCVGLDPTLESEEQDVVDCNFCPDGGDVAFPDRELLGLNITCAELASRVQGGSDCPTLYDTEFDVLLDTAIYCGCPEVSPTGDCAFCPPGEALVNPDRVITDGVGVTDATCAEYAALAESTFDDTFCAAMQNIGDLNDCCGPDAAATVTHLARSSSETNNGTSLNSTRSAEDFCQLCPDGSPVADSEKLFLGTDVTCQAYYDEIASVPVGDECDAIFHDYSTMFDPQIYCGCPGVESTGQCSLCAEGTEIVDPTIFISDIFTTCGQMNDIAEATSDSEFCLSLQRVGEYYCCSSPGDGNGGGGKRNLRRTTTEVVTAAAAAHELVNAQHQRLYHFSALKAINSVQNGVASIVAKRVSTTTSSEMIDTEEHY